MMIIKERRKVAQGKFWNPAFTSHVLVLLLGFLVGVSFASFCR